jgi:hypothetical protein
MDLLSSWCPLLLGVMSSRLGKLLPVVIVDAVQRKGQCHSQLGGTSCHRGVRYFREEGRFTLRLWVQWKELIGSQLGWTGSRLTVVFDTGAMSGGLACGRSGENSNIYSLVDPAVIVVLQAERTATLTAWWNRLSLWCCGACVRSSRFGMVVGEVGDTALLVAEWTQLSDW